MLQFERARKSSATAWIIQKKDHRKKEEEGRTRERSIACRKRGMSGQGKKNGLGWNIVQGTPRTVFKKGAH